MITPATESTAVEGLNIPEKEECLSNLSFALAHAPSNGLSYWRLAGDGFRLSEEPRRPAKL